MKNLIKIGLVAFLMMSFSGCNEGKANFEDQELTKQFIKTNKDKLDQIHHIKTFWQYGVLDKRGDLVTNVYLSLFGAPYFDYGFNDCSYVMFIDSGSVTFTKDDIGHYGKEAMYKEAEKCLNAVIKEIKKTEIETKRKEIEKQIQVKNYEDKLNKKFDGNSVNRQ